MLNVVNLVIILVSIYTLIIGVYTYFQSRRIKRELRIKGAEVKRKMYELSILKELGDRMGYSLNVQNIVDIIYGSLGQFLKYSVVSYMLIKPEKILFKVQLEESVSKKFINDIKGRMLKSLSALINTEIDEKSVEEAFVGAILSEDTETNVKSFFNIPLVIAGKVVGVLTVASVKEGLYKEDEMTLLYKITEQASNAVTKLQEVVEAEQRKMNAMVSSISEGIVMVNREYGIVVVNPAAKTVIGVEQGEEVDIFDFIQKLGNSFDIRGKLEESMKLDRVLAEREVQIGEMYFRVFVSPVRQKMEKQLDKILGGVVIFQDITEIMNAEKMRDDFSSMIVHELRSPLDGIKKLTEIMPEDSMWKDKSQYLGNVNLIRGASSEMLELVNDLLDVAKLESGKFEVSVVESELKKLIDGRVAFYGASAKEKGVDVSAVYSEGTPDKLNFDPQRISQVLNNLISNALKFSAPDSQIFLSVIAHKKGVDLSAELAAAGFAWHISEGSNHLIEFPDAVVVGVTDFGPGIKKESIPLLFEKYAQFEAAMHSEIKGTGLGLTVSRGIVEAHGGVISLGSQEGKGTTMYFALPI